MSDPTRFWRRGVWISLLVLLLSLLSLAPYLTSSTELVRMRHALLLVVSPDGGLDWTPATLPANFLLERAPPYPVFTEVVDRLGLKAIPSDWDRTLAISRHLLGSSPALSGGAIQSDLLDTYQPIVGKGEGYCGDFVRVFMGLATAAGIPVRAWAFSFDGFGGHGHIWLEIWNRQLGRWQLVDTFNNYYFVGEEGVPLSALEFRQVLRATPPSLQLLLLHPGARPGYAIEAKAWDYYRRGLAEWYMVWGNNVFSYDRALLVRAFGSVSRSLEQLGGISQGVYPGIRILADPDNQRQLAAIHGLRIHLWFIGILSVIALLALLLSLAGWWKSRRSLATRSEK
ncbi:transglutaminase domain-containing protein [Candidatus Accumulibacter phosphatis]|uniref:Transglutaminase-like domain-containing protein n=1 Tax=Candidatus Accumulibacter phosphatis TaxID=327160 RepID=A0A5S4ENH5_9PROT|nr:transglutaminase domain-containing protein [Candidatus Accumulibacter phosphatis]TMQ76865.1 hypothetical protein ACCUM_3827 [Candidatus Accumulibacter phosphatis]